MIRFIHKPVIIGGDTLAYHTADSLWGDKLLVHSWPSMQAMIDEQPSAAVTYVPVPPGFNLETAAETLVADPSSMLYQGVIGTAMPSRLSLEDYKASAWERIKGERTRCEYGPFTWDGSQFDADSESQRRIQGAVQLAGLALAAGQPFQIDWTLYDNTVRTLTAQEMIAVGLALGEHVAAQYAIGRMLRASIEAATTVEELDAVVWPS